MALTLVVTMFEWWNSVFRAGESFTAAGFAAFFTEDARLIVNGELRASGLAALAAHFEKIRLSLDTASIGVPLEYGFAAGEDAFVHYRVDCTIGGAPESEEAMGYVHLSDGRIAIMKLLSRGLG